MLRLRDLELRPHHLTLGALLPRQAERNGDKPFLLFEDQAYSFRETDDMTRRLAANLRHRGVTKGAHVAILADNAPETFFMHLALGRLGAVACAVNTAAKGDMLRYFLEYADCTAIVVDATGLGRFEEVSASVPRIGKVVVLGTPVRNAAHIGYDELLEADDGKALPEVLPTDVHGIFFTSGTTGPSKGVVATVAQILTFATGRVEYLGLRPDDVIYTCLPLFHGNALHTAGYAALVADATFAMGRRFSASGFWDDIRRYKATQVNLLSSMTDILWGRPPSARDRDHGLRQCTMVPVPAFARDFEQRFGVQIVSSYALSDFGQGTFLQPDYPAAKFRSAGLPRAGISLRILDDDDHISPPGVPGEICLRAASPELGPRSYYKMPAETDAAIRDGWFRTGDRGFLDTQGYLFFVDRKKDAIRRRGENISSWEVEQALLAHPALAEVAVIPVDSGMSEDEVAAFLVAMPGMRPMPEDVIRFCERNLAYFMVPRFIVFVDALPKTATEKIQKQVLRDIARENPSIFWDREGADINLTR